MIIRFLTSTLLPKQLFATVPYYHWNLHHKLHSTESSSSSFKLNNETIRLLEKISLVNFENQRYIAIVESAIEFADGINEINTDNVEPLITVLEDRSLKLREDIVTEGKCRKEILRNAAVTEEDYFVAPPGNIPVNLKKLKN